MIFKIAREENIKFVVNGENLVVDIKYWNGQRWITGKGILQQKVVESGEFDSISEVSKAVSAIYETIPPDDLKIEYYLLDAKRTLLPTPKGMIDIFCRFSKHNPENYNTKLINYVPEEGMDTPVWDNFLEDCCSKNGQRDGEYEKYLTQILGYSLFGLTDRKELYFLYGPSGNNGKSTLFNLMNTILGPQYAFKAKDAILVKKANSSERFSLASLRGKRFVTFPELEAGSKLNINTLKDLTGKTDAINAEEKYQTEFNFVPECKLFCATNHLPEITTKGSLSAIRQRVRILPFENHIPDSQIDKDLDEKLEKEIPGILAKLINAAAYIYKNNVTPPARVKKEEQQGFSSKDTIAEFLSMYEENPECSFPCHKVKALYEQWLLETYNEQSPFRSTRTFNSALRERNTNLYTDKKGGVQLLFGINFSKEVKEETKPATKKKRNKNECWEDWIN